MAEKQFPPRPARGLGPAGRRIFDQDEGDLYGSRRLPTEENPYGATGAYTLFPAATDFGPYTLDEADSYYQGPTRSTRVRAHQFVPDDPNIIQQISQAVESGTLSQRQFSDFNIMGQIYVRFIKNNTLWRYGVYTPIPLAEYRNFRNSVSKGKSVRYLEQYGHGEAVSVPDGVLI